MVRYLFNCLNELDVFRDDSDTAIFSDIDGTLSEVNHKAVKPQITSERRDTINKIVNRFKFTGVLTGRDIVDALNIIQLEKLVYIGNHGLQQFKDDKIVIDPQIESYIPIVRDVNKALQEKLGTCAGFSFDYKKLSLTVHYRDCDDEDEAKEQILDVIMSIDSYSLLRIVEGRKLLEIRPKVGDDKGTVLHKFILENNIEKIMYLGDDINDLDAFNKLRELTSQKRVMGVSIAVDSFETPDYVKYAADFYVKNVREVYAFLRWLSLWK